MTKFNPMFASVFPALAILLAQPILEQTVCADSPADARPNIVLIMVDDMGFSDPGCYGGEIETPNLDRLAASGLRFTQFYNCAKCETTRATLMSGRFHPEVKTARLENCITIAEVMKLAGYRTLMTGKWHLSEDPLAHGFENYFGHLSGATNFFRGDDTFRLGREVFEVPEDGFYTTDANTDYAIQFLNETENEKPFFLYIAHNAPHYPLQAPEEDVTKYLGKYREGWDVLREQRFQRQLEIGLFPEGTVPAMRADNVPAWNDLPAREQDTYELMMATYAGMIDRVDQNLGRLLQHLESSGQLDNTLIMFWSDNGACPFQRTSERTREENLAPWDPESYWVYDRGWAHACNTPFREYKQNQHEGGICTPMIVHWPQRLADPGRITRQPGHLVDIMATCADVAEFEIPDQFEGQTTGPLRGASLAPIFAGEVRDQADRIYFCFQGKNNAIRVGDWKLVNRNFGEFELYNLATDRTEQNNLADSEPEKFAEMSGIWREFSAEIGQTNRQSRRGEN
ncbi:MAG: arylsulfatase [Planctomycetota bacterium]